jgi:ribose transport system ATP-binding protein
MDENAKALSLRASLLIMDEPTSSLTLTETARLLDVVKDLRSQGVGVIYISHRLREVEEIADRVVVLRDGALVGTLERSEINHERMVKLMVGRQIKHGEHGPSNKETDYFSVENLRTFRYPQKSVSLRVGKGEILGLAGLVGAGRSETAQAIFGVDGAMHGATVRLNGETLRINSPGDAVRHGIFLIPEDRRGMGLVIDFPIRQNATLASLEKSATAGLISFKRERAAAQKICGELNVKAPSVEERVGNLSGGNQQKVVLAKWLSLAPKVLIFDEPTRGIDVGAKAEIYALMRRLADSGVSIIMISSEMEEILEMSDRVAVMHEGGITGVLDRAHCTEEAIMHLAVGKTGGGE